MQKVYNPRIQPAPNLNLFVVVGRSFSSTSVQSFANVFFIKESIFASTISTKRAPCEFAHTKRQTVLRITARKSICSHGIH